MNSPLYSIRMHATRQGQHLSGAEHLTPAEQLDALAAKLVRRALEHPRGTPESIQLTVDLLEAEAVQRATLPALATLPVTTVAQGRQAALSALVEAGVSPAVAQAGIDLLISGAAPGGGVMRGAVLMQAVSGERLEADPARGVRVSRMDLDPSAATTLRQQLAVRGLDNAHVREALVLAGKVLLAPGMVAELCWSDDPDYSAGYVASPTFGYRRFPHLKPLGEERGGRIFFWRGVASEIAAVVAFLERTPVLFDALGELLPDLPSPQEA
ncbi:MAG: 6-carboxyhexanoate--CoA ligase [Desulfuromonas sp.]|nr:MAG: 6-carboxyhexanoate--CoA ligase [Desulfuromonas sp.]